MLPKEVVVSYVEAFNRGDLDGLCELFAPDALIWGVLGWGNVEKVRPIWKDLIECLEINLEIEGIIEEGSEEASIVAARYTEQGRSAKPFHGYAATGKSYEVTAMEWFEIRGDRIYRRWGARDSAAQFRQMGFIS